MRHHHGKNWFILRFYLATHFVMCASDAKREAALSASSKSRPRSSSQQSRSTSRLYSATASSAKKKKTRTGTPARAFGGSDRFAVRFQKIRLDNTHIAIHVHITTHHKQLHYPCPSIFRFNAKAKAVPQDLLAIYFILFYMLINYATIY